MKLFGWLGSLFDDADATYSTMGTCESMYPMNDAAINPANGLPMIGAIDIEGNPYGTNFSHDNYENSLSHHDSSSGFGGDW